MKKLNFRSLAKLFILALLFSFSHSLFGQTTGDYRSKATGNWTTLTTWERYSGSAWTEPTLAQGWPGQFPGTGAVTIRTGNTVSIGAAGITTQTMGKLTIQSGGQLYLTGANQNVNFNLNTPEVDVVAGGSIYFFNKSTLALPANAVISATDTPTPGLTGDGCNNNKVITIGGVTYGVCAGAPGTIYTFAEIMAAGGTVNAVITTNAPQCEGTVITLDGSYTGTAGTTTPGGSTPGVNYAWNITGPGGYSASATTQNTTIPGTALPGNYTVSLTVSTYKSSQLYTNTETIIAVVNPMPTLSGATLAAPACENFPAIINLTGLMPSTTSTINYTIAGGAIQSATGVVADASGNASFATVNLSLANDGQTLQITGITITSTTPGCTKSFSQNVTLQVNPTGMWLGLVSTDWNDASNWCGGVPTATTDVVIPSTAPYQPVIGAVGGLCRNITINSSASLTVSDSNTLSVYGDWNNSGTFTPNLGTVSFLGSTAQSIGNQEIFYGLTINNTSGITLSHNLTVNGTLNLASANPSATQGTLHTGSHTLFMGATATTVGTGDVSGRIKRTTIAANTTYTFGSQYTTLVFTGGSGTELPDEILVIVKIGEAHPTKTDALQRYYEIIRSGAQPGSSPTRFNLTLRYLDSELNGNVESNLVFWDHHVPYASPSPHEHGQSAHNTTDNYITLASHGIGYLVENEYTGEIAYIDDTTTPQNQSKIWMISERLTPTGNNVFIWQGAISNDWDENTNWINDGNLSPTNAAPGIPANTHLIYIPKAAQYDPSPSGNVTAARIYIEDEGVLATNNYNFTASYLRIYEGGTLNGGSSTIEVTGAININNGDVSWNNLGTFNAGTSLVRFTNADAAMSGATDFYDVEVATSAKLSLIGGTVMSIGNVITVNGTWNTTFYGPTTVAYNGTGNQNVLVPEGSEYHNLVLEGGGIKTLPATTLNILGNLTLDASISATGNTIVMSGSVLQTIGGATSATLNNLTLNNAAGVTLGNSQTVAGTLDLTSGLLTTGAQIITVGTDSPVCAGGSITNASSSSYVVGKLARVYCGVGSKTFPIGKGGNYRPLILEYTALTGTSLVTTEQFEAQIPGSIPLDVAYLEDRYWSVTQSGGSGFTYDITIDGTPFTPGDGNPRILKGDGSSNNAISATYTVPNFTATGLGSMSNFTVASDCPTPVITSQPAAPAEVCEETGTPTFSVSATGTGLNYQWEESTTGTSGTFAPIADGGVYSGTESATLTITNPPYSMNGYAYRVVVSLDCGSEVTSDAVLLTVNPFPAAVLGLNPTVCCEASTALLSFSLIAGSPDRYSVTFDSDALTAGFVDVSEETLTGSPIEIAIPSGITGTFNAELVLSNSSSGCESVGYQFTITINPCPQGSLSGNSVCYGETGQLTFTATAGTAPFTIEYSDGTNSWPAYNVYSGTPFSVEENPTLTTQYTLVSVTDALGCQRTNTFTQGTANVTVFGYSGGDGTSGNPFQIATLADLQFLSENDCHWDKHFIQTADIDASATSSWNGGEGFRPIGYYKDVTFDKYFTGSYDGKGYTISGLTILRLNPPTGYCQGMFGTILDATLVRINLRNVDIYTSTGIPVGGLVGNALSSTISLSSVSGKVKGISSIGGLVGSLMDGSSISESYANCEVSGYYDYVGGLVGISYYTSSIDDCYATGPVTGNDRVGGLVGQNGYVDNSIIRNSYATGPVVGNTNTGGLVGYNNGGSVSQSFWDTQTTMQANSSGGGTGKTTQEMKTKTTFTDAGWSFNPIWGIIEATAPDCEWSYPYLVDNHQIPEPGLESQQNPTDGGEIAADETTVCYGDATIVFSSVDPASGHIGVLEYQWQISTASPTFVNIVGALSETYTHIGTITQTTWFRRLAKIGCIADWDGAVATDAVEISVITSNATDYFRSKTSGNWSELATWESSANGTDWCDATLIPDNQAESITIRSTHNVTVDVSSTASNLIIEAGGTLTAAANLTVSGNWTNNGSFSSGTGTIVFNGTNEQTLGGSAETSFYGLTINNSAGLQLGNNQSVSNQLSLTNGIIATNTSVLSVLENGTIVDGSASSHVSGKLARVFDTTGSKNFPIGKDGNFYPMSLEFTSLTGTSTVIAESYSNGFPGTSPLGTIQVGTRYWNLTQAGGSSFMYDITLDGTGLTFSHVPVIFKYDDPVTVAHIATTPDYTATGLTSFSDFALGENTCQSPNISVEPSTSPQLVCQSAVADELFVTASGDGLSYQWYKNTVGVASGGDIVGTNTNTYTPETNDAGTLYYYVVITGDCGTATSTVSGGVTVYPEFTSGAIATTGETICYNGDPVEIGSDTDASGGDGNITYEWRSSADSYTAAIGGATAATYTPPAGLTGTTSYRRYAKDGTCNTSPEQSTGEWTVSVRDSFTAGEISSTGETICYAGTPSEIGSTTDASGGDGNITYEWRSSADSYTAAIGGATAATYTPPAGLTVTTSYRRYAKDDTCNTTPVQSTGEWTVSVRDQFTAGAIATEGETICYAGSPSEIGSTTNASGGDGNITYEWRSSTDSYTAAIGGATAATYTPPAGLKATTSYRRYAKDGTCNTTPVQSTGEWTVTVSPLTEYRSVDSGDWKDHAVWEQRQDGVNWVAATSYPGETIVLCGNPLATIRSGHTVTLENSAIFGSVTVEEDGKLVLGEDPLAKASYGLEIIATHTLTVQSGGILDLMGETGLVTGEGDFILQGGATIIIGSSQGISASGFTGNVQNTGLRYFDPGANYKYMGNVAQEPGDGLPETLFTLTIDNPFGLFMTEDITVSGFLYLQNGLIRTGPHVLVLTNPDSDAIVGGSKQSYVIGQLQRNMDGPGPYLFPVGSEPPQ